MENRIFVAGNIVVDCLYPITGYPNPGELTTIEDGISQSVGGSVCNVGIDLKRLMPDCDICALGLVGRDSMGDFALRRMAGEGMDVSHVRYEGSTSFTAVMSDTKTKERTFFQFRGSNAHFSEDSFDWDDIKCDIMHVAYILLLDELDREDFEYGTKMARLLAHAKEHGIKTSIDVVSERGERFRRLVPPALKFTDYCVINEVETQASTGIVLRDEEGKLVYSNIKKALSALFDLGVSEWAVIHCPEGGFGMDKNGSTAVSGHLNIPADYIKGTVGAGDAFCAGILTAVQKGMTLKEALLLGNASACMSLAEPGATEGMDTAEAALKIAEKFGIAEIPSID